MSKRARYEAYYKRAIAPKEEKKRSTKKSLIRRLKELKGQEFVMNVPIGGADGE